MGFKKNAEDYFKGKLGLTNRDIAKRMDNYSEVLVSRYMNQDEISVTFIKKIQKYFPEADINELIRQDDDKLHVLTEEGEKYDVDLAKRIDKVIEELLDIKESLSQK